MLGIGKERGERQDMVLERHSRIAVFISQALGGEKKEWNERAGVTREGKGVRLSERDSKPTQDERRKKEKGVQ